MDKSDNGYYLNELIETIKNNLDTIGIVIVTTLSDIDWILPASKYHDFEMMYFIKGDARLNIRGYNLTAKAGDLFLAHNFEPNSCTGSSYTYLSICFSVNDYNNTNKNIYDTIVNCFRNFPGKFSCKDKRYVEGLFFEMIKEYLIRQVDYELDIKLSFLQILISAIRSSSSIREVVPYNYVKYTQVVSEIIVFLSENLQKSYTLAELGEKYNLNPRYLNRIFKNVTSFPIYKYLQRLRIDKAKKLLESSSLSILEIAHESGFESSQCLDRAFIKATHLTPGKYRKMITR